MPQILLVVIILIALAIVSRKVRAVLLHVKLWRFLRVFIMTLFIIALLAVIAGSAWYWWTVLRLREPQTSWNDETIQQDMHPVTPGSGGPKKPTLVE